MKISQFLPKIPELKQIQFPKIEPIGDNNRPFWSVMITSYKRKAYIAQAIQSVLSQGIAASEMQIEVVDDCSPNSEEIEAIVQEVGQGRVSFYRQPKNVGIYANWNTCITRARGHWIHILSDDDLLMPDFYKTYRVYIDTYKCQAILGQSIYINEKEQWIGVSNPLQNEDGILNNALWVLSRSNQVHTPAIVVAREAYEKLGGYTSDLVFTPDWEMWTRLALHFSLVYANRPYTFFREHSSSETNRLALTGDSVTDVLAVSKIIQTRFNDLKTRQEINNYINDWIIYNSKYLSHQLVTKGYYKAAFLHAIWVMRLKPRLSSIKYFVYIFLKTVKSFIKRMSSNTLVQN